MGRAFVGAWATVAAAVGLVGAPLGAGPDAPSKPEPASQALTAEQVIEKSIEATGGRKAWEKVRTLEMKTVLEIVNQGIKVRGVELSRAPDRLYTLSEITGMMRMERGYDGATGWSRDPIHGLRKLEGAELAQMRRGAIDATVDWRKYFAKAEVAGKEPFDGTESYKLELTPKQGEGGVVTRWYDAKTFLLLGQKEKAVTADGEMEGTIRFDDYREVEGIRMPFRIRMDSPVARMEGKLESVAVNGKVDESKFRMPKEDDE